MFWQYIKLEKKTVGQITGRLLCYIKELALYLLCRSTNYGLKGQIQLLACTAHELRLVFKLLSDVRKTTTTKKPMLQRLCVACKA